MSATNSAAALVITNKELVFKNEVKEKLRAKYLESIGILSGGVAHDLNNSLGPLVSLPQMILEDIEVLIWNLMTPSKG
jgi:two-component system cell cycle sensor histidine kinase/response regulator CckA